MISTRKLVVVALGLSALVAACNNDPTLPPAPAKPPQIRTSAVYINTHDNKGLPSNDVYSILAVSNGELWIATNAGIARYPDLTTTVRPPANLVNEVNGLPHPQVKAMAELDSKVFVATWGGGIAIYDIATNAWTQVRPGTTGLTEGYIADIATSATEDKVYFASNDGVFIYAPSTSTWTHVSTVDSDPTSPSFANPNDNNYFETVRLQSTISSVAVTENGGIVTRWYGPRTEIRVDDPDLFGIIVSKNTNSEFRYTTTNSGLVERNVNDVHFDDVTQTYWVSYVTKGISQVDVDAKTWTDYTLVQGLPSNTVYMVTRASDGSASGTTMWAATQNGLAKLEGSNWQGYGRSGGLPADRVRVVYSDDGKRLWAGFVDGGAARIDTKSTTTK